MSQSATPTVGSDAVVVVERAIAKTRQLDNADALAPDATVRGLHSARPTSPSTLAPIPTDRLPLLPLDRIEQRGHDEHDEHEGHHETAPRHRSDAEWILRTLLGEGGMGQVYSGTQQSLGRNVAVKVATSDAAREALLREARVTGRLEHPNIVPVHVLGVDGTGAPVMVMKRIEGVSWRALLRDREHGQWRRWETQHRDALEANVSVLLSVCDALEYAHQKRVIHRDVKPDNVMIGPFGEVYLLDWGIALELDDTNDAAEQALSDGAIVGTPAYMPPEFVDATDAAVGPRSDVYLLGACLYEVLEGRPPHAASTIFATLAAAYESASPVFTKDPPAFLAALCASAMRRAPDERIADVASFGSKLREWLAHRDSLSSTALGQSALDATANDGPDSLARIVDARLAFERALRLWPDNSQARAGLERALRAEFSAEIARTNSVAARSLLDELSSMGAARQQDIDALSALEAKRSTERAEAQRANAAQRELDLSGWRGPRVWLFSLVSLAMGLAAAAIARSTNPNYAMLLRADVVVIALFALGVWWFRQRLAGNRIGRRLVSVLLLCALASTTIDALGLWLRWPLVWGSVHRLLAIGVVLFFAALMEIRALFVGAGLAVVGALLVALVPDRHVTVTPLVMVAINIATGWLVASGRARSMDEIE